MATAPPTKAPPPQPPPAEVGAAIAAATATPAGLAVAGTVAGALTAAQIRAITRATLAALRRLSRLRIVALLPLAQRHAAPISPLARMHKPAYSRRRVLEQLADDERGYEAEFRRKQLARINRDLPKALAQPSDLARRRRLEGLIGRETHYTRLRLDAIAVRAAGVAASVNVEAYSPDAAVWQLGRTLNHTPGCLLLHGRALAWQALREERYVPPAHLRCDCRLRGLDEAVAEGLGRRVVPTVAASRALILAAKRLEGDA